MYNICQALCHNFTLTKIGTIKKTAGAELKKFQTNGF